MVEVADGDAVVVTLSNGNLDRPRRGQARRVTRGEVVNKSVEIS